MATVNFTPISDGTNADAADVNTPLQTIYNEFNGNIDNANIKSAAAISGSKLADASIDLGAKGSVFDGWIPVSDSWAYASATTITVPSDATTKYAVGDKIKLVQSATTKYFYVTAVSSTVLTVTGGSDYTVANSAISGIYYSKAATPQGFPQWFNYTPTWTNLTPGSGTQASSFSMVGKTINVRLSLIWAADTSISGAVSFTLPVTAASTYNTRVFAGNVRYTDANSTDFWGVVSVLTTTTGALTVGGAAVTYVNDADISSTVPFTWTTNDEIRGTFVYQAA